MAFSFIMNFKFSFFYSFRWFTVHSQVSLFSISLSLFLQPCFCKMWFANFFIADTIKWRKKHIVISKISRHRLVIFKLLFSLFFFFDVNKSLLWNVLKLKIKLICRLIQWSFLLCFSSLSDSTECVTNLD